jgi:UDP-N-acetylmuramyl pentapeptide phosphotransferase/UDP-N-acetylglucosamine-1-phosphate transferase
MLALAISFLTSLLITLLVIRYKHLHAHVTADHDLDGVQKFHETPVPRVGGIGVFLGVLGGLLAKAWIDDPVAAPNLILLACALPAFGAGLVEDLTKRVGVRERLMATAFSALLGGYFLGAWLTRLDIPGLDSLLHPPMLHIGWDAITITGFLAIAVTAFAVAGVANAFNIIDGYNGLSGVVAIISLLGLAYVADQVGDRLLLVGALSLVGAIAGFLVWNYPNGLIFLGDGGAYFVGFLVAELSVLMVARNAQVSPWFPLMLSFYPIFETLFTIYRRVIISKRHPGMPDAAHLHQLIYRRVVRWAVGSYFKKHKTHRNALTSPFLWLMSSLAVIPATIFWQSSWLLQLFALLFAATYLLIYRSIQEARFSKWLSIQQKRKQS